MKFADDVPDAVPDLTPAEISQWRRDARARGVLGPERIAWEPCAPTPSELLQELRFVPPPTQPGANATQEQIFGWHYSVELWHERDNKRRQSVADLGIQKRTQLEADWAYPDAKEPYWLCSVQAQGRMPDSAVPPALVRASSEHIAGERYKQLCGIISLEITSSGDGQKLVVERWEGQTAVGSSSKQ
jgi:hypothetical protein